MGGGERDVGREGGKGGLYLQSRRALMRLCCWYSPLVLSVLFVICLRGRADGVRSS